MLNFDCGIYTITSPSGKQYVGSAVSFKSRWASHLSLLRRGKHHSRGLQRAFNKYGGEALVFAKVAIVPREDLIFREQEQIDAREWRSLYNSSPTADRPLGVKHSKEAREKMAAAQRGRKHSSATRAKMSAWQVGKEVSGETRAKIAEAARNLSDETRAKMSAASKRRTSTPEARAKLSSAQKGKKLSAETKARLSVAFKGREFSPETRAKLSAANKARWARVSAEKLNSQEPT